VQYSAEISRTNPTTLYFVVDQSGSMSDSMSSGRSKAQFVADALNRTLANLIVRCTKSDGVRDYFSVGLLTYGGDGVKSGFSTDLASATVHPISRIEAAPLRVEDRKRKLDDGAGGIVEQNVKFPVWFDAHARGGTPMCEALRRTAVDMVAWSDNHPTGYPPTILHVTDGESTDGDPEELATQLRQIATSDGPLLMFNLHVSTIGAAAVKFPSSEVSLPDAFAKLLFRMSSLLPEHLEKAASDKGFSVGRESRGFMFNAEAPEIADFFDIGTRSSDLR
jgi:hypothetical protein